jgi:adenylosuccinate lyase
MPESFRLIDMTTIHELTALSPLDGRYAKTLKPLREYFSEFSLIKWRLHVEIEWLIALSKAPQITHISELSNTSIGKLQTLATHFSPEQALQVKTIETQTLHDVKAVEYYLKEHLKKDATLNQYTESIHFALTSADLNNLAYALMLKEAKQHCILPTLTKLYQQLSSCIKMSQSLPMLARTHGQPASPTTLAKELSVFATRLKRQIHQLEDMQILAKCNGAVGNFNAHHVAYPDVDWQAFSFNFIRNFGLEPSPLTTQIEPHDTLAEHADLLCRINTICIDLARDIWGYISLNYFTQQIQSGQIGSSTMPHKINPIDFENAEGNFGLSNALLTHMARKLPCSRWQRDLTDSTVLRNLGVALGHAQLGYHSLILGLSHIQPNAQALSTDLNQHWTVLAEALQTIMRQHGIDQGYEQLKLLTQGVDFTKEKYINFVQSLHLPDSVKSQLMTLTPDTYIGLAKTLEHTQDLTQPE